jgi:hypothetical protein
LCPALGEEPPSRVATARFERETKKKGQRRRRGEKLRLFEKPRASGRPELAAVDPSVAARDATPAGLLWLGADADGVVRYAGTPAARATPRASTRERRATPEQAREGEKGAAASPRAAAAKLGGRATTGCDGRQHVPWRVRVQWVHGGCRCARCGGAGSRERGGKCFAAGLSAKTRIRCYSSAWEKAKKKRKKVSPPRIERGTSRSLKSLRRKKRMGLQSGALPTEL